MGGGMAEVTRDGGDQACNPLMPSHSIAKLNRTLLAYIVRHKQLRSTLGAKVA